MQLLRRYRERKLQTSQPADSVAQRKLDIKKSQSTNHTSMATGLSCSALARNPVSPHMSNESMRIASFRFNGIWDYTKVAATPEQLAMAGFYYLGHSDRVQCFYCNGALESWDYGDDPWIEHTKWYPCCEYVLCKKGQDFVAGVISQFPDIERPDPKKIRDAPPEAFLAAGNPFRTEQNRARQGIFDPKTRAKRMELRVLECMDTSHLVRQALELGIEREKVQQATRMQYETKNKDFATLDDLLDALDSIEHRTLSLCEDDVGALHGSDKIARKTPAQCSERECKICFDNDADIVFLPCGHLTTCETCALRVRTCPICRCHIRDKVKTYTS